MEKKKFKTTQEMYPLIESYLAGNQNQLDFCASTGMKPHLLSYWLQKYKTDKDERPREVAGFSKLKIIEMPVDEAKKITIRCANGTIIEIPL